MSSTQSDIRGHGSSESKRKSVPISPLELFPHERYIKGALVESTFPINAESQTWNPSTNHNPLLVCILRFYFVLALESLPRPLISFVWRVPALPVPALHPRLLRPLFDIDSKSENDNNLPLLGRSRSVNLACDREVQSALTAFFHSLPASCLCTSATFVTPPFVQCRLYPVPALVDVFVEGWLFIPLSPFLPFSLCLSRVSDSIPQPIKTIQFFDSHGTPISP